MSTKMLVKRACTITFVTVLLMVPLSAISRTFDTPFEPVPGEQLTLDSDHIPLRVEAAKPPPVRQNTQKAPLVAPKAPQLTPESSRRAYVTGYNTVAGQTDATPCDAMGGYICGRMDTVACPRDIPLHAWVEIDGKPYECMDRTALKHDGRFDISCDKDTACPYAHTGWKTVRRVASVR